MKYILLTVLVVFVFAGGGAMGEAGCMLRANGTYLSIDRSTGGITGIVNRTSKYDFISAADTKPKLWRLILKKKSGETATFSNTDCPAPQISQTKASIKISYKNIQQAGIAGSLNVDVYCKADSSLLRMRIKVQNDSDATILSCVFPEIGGLGRAGISNLAFPKYNWGEMFYGLKDSIWGYYPSADTPMQFCSITDGKDSIYLATHDPGSLSKTFHVQPGAVYSVETSVPDSGTTGNDWEMPFDFAMYTYQGDWMQSCKTYRNWAIKNAPWTARGPISKRKDVSKAVRDVGVWLNLAENFEENGKSAIEFQKQIGVPVGVHWYSWHSNPFDRDYPDYLPAKPGFAETVKLLNRAGIYSMPYINGRLWDTQNKNYQTAKDHATTNSQGEPNLEDYGSGTKLAVMCLGDSFWQDKLADIISQVRDATGVGGIYIDQVAGAPITECYNPSHGHSLGKGRWWVDGYRKAISKAREHALAAHQPIFVAAENNAEPYMDFVDLFLIWIPRSQNDIPMMTAVYGGYAQYFGTNRASDSDVSFAMLQARDFTWGAQLFWESAYVLQQGQQNKMEILRNLARLRYQARDFFVNGEMVELIRPLNSIPTLTGKWGGWNQPLEDRTLPAVHAALWKHPNGTYAAALANADSKNRKYEFTFNPAGNTTKKWQMTKLTADTKPEKPVEVNRNARVSVDIAPRSGAVLIFKTKN